MKCFGKIAYHLNINNLSDFITEDWNNLFDLGIFWTVAILDTDFQIELLFSF